MFEKTVSMEVEKAFEGLRILLLKNKCKIVAEEKLKSITVEQGSLWRVTPKGVRKTLSFYLIPEDLRTRIVSNSSFTLDLMLVSMLGYVLAGIVAFIFWWLSIDLEAYMNNGGGIIWRSLTFSYVSIQQTLFMVNLFKTLSTASIIVLIYCIIADIYVYTNKDSFAKKTLESLEKNDFLENTILIPHQATHETLQT